MQAVEPLSFEDCRTIILYFHWFTRSSLLVFRFVLCPFFFKVAKPPHNVAEKGFCGSMIQQNDDSKFTVLFSPIFDNYIQISSIIEKHPRWSIPSTQSPHSHSLQPRPRRHNPRISLHIQTIIQMRRQDQIPVQTDIVTQMTIRAHFARRHVPKPLPIIRISIQHHTVDESRLGRIQHLGGIVRHLRSLAVSTNHQFRPRTLRHGLPDQQGHVLTPRRASSGLEPGDVGRVIVNALDGDLGGAEQAVQRGDEGRADDAADVAGFGGAAGEDQG